MTIHLMLHGLGVPPPRVSAGEARYWLSVEKFERILELAKRHSAQISIDDGNDTDIRIALPALKRAGLTAFFFVPTDRVGQPGYLNADDIHALHDAGMTVGSHGCAHIEWTKVSDAEIAADVSKSIDVLSALLNEPITDVAVPFGDCDLRVMRVLHKLGMVRVFTSFRGRTSDGAWIIRRTCVTTDTSLAEIEDVLARSYTAFDDVLAFLRVWKHVGHAALWRRPNSLQRHDALFSPLSTEHRRPAGKSPAYK